jgi:hypothetical protein
VNYTCGGAGYMYCAPWALNSNTGFGVAKGASDNSSDAMCGTFNLAVGITCSVCFAGE